MGTVGLKEIELIQQMLCDHHTDKFAKEKMSLFLNFDKHIQNLIFKFIETQDLKCPAGVIVDAIDMIEHLKEFNLLNSLLPLRCITILNNFPNIIYEKEIINLYNKYPEKGKRLETRIGSCFDVYNDKGIVRDILDLPKIKRLIAAILKTINTK